MTNHPGSAGAGRDGRLQEQAWQLMDRIYKKVCQMAPGQSITTAFYDFGVPIIVEELKALAVPDPLASSSEPQGVDLERIKADWLHGYIENLTDIEAFRAASRDVRLMIEEIERLRASSVPVRAAGAPDSILDVKRWIHEWCQRHGYPGGTAAIGVAGAKELLRCDRIARIDTRAVVSLSDVASGSPSEDSPAVRASGEPQTEKRIREYLWLTHGHQGQYGDDGEMQCSACAPVWDYRRMPLGELVEQAFKVREERVIAALIKAQASASPSDDGARQTQEPTHE